MDNPISPHLWIPFATACVDGLRRRREPHPFLRGYRERFLCLSLAFAFCFQAIASGEIVLSRPNPIITERGPHHQRWESVSTVVTDAGDQVVRTNSFVQLGTGLNRWDASLKRWVTSSDEIEIVNGYGVGRGGQYRVILSPTTTTRGGLVDLETPQRDRIVLQPVGLAVTDATGRSVFLAEVVESQGILISSNRMLYPDAFDFLSASILIRTSVEGIESDVILSEKIDRELLEKLEVDPETAKLEVWHEVLKKPRIKKKIRTIARKAGFPDEDHRVDFGGMSISPGTAFSIQKDGQAKTSAEDVSVAKEFVTVEGIDFLIESVPFLEAEAELAELPESPKARHLQSQAASPKPGEGKRGRTRPQPSPFTAPLGEQGKLVAVALPNRRIPNGFVIDYPITLSSQTNFTFRGDTTYYVTNKVLLYGTTRLEGGAVIKTVPYNAAVQAQVRVMGAFECLTSPYHPAIFTARDDDTVGEILPDSLGTVSSNFWYSTYNIYFETPESVQLHDIQTRHGHVGVYFGDSGPHTAWNVQVFRCYRGLEFRHSNVYLRNALFHFTRYAINPQWSATGTLRAEHVTIDNSAFLFGTGAFGTLHLTNALLREVANSGGTNVFADHVETVDVSAFKISGRGRHYLPEGSPHRNAGTTHLSAEMTRLLRDTTTAAPVAFANDVTENTILSPIVPRDTDLPDLGFHYYPLDYLLGEIVVNGSTLELQNGIAIGTFGSHPFILTNGANLISQGLPHIWNRIAPFNSVQGEPVSWGAPREGFVRVEGTNGTLSLRFTETGMLANSPERRTLINNYTDKTNVFENISIADSRLMNYAQGFRTLSPAHVRLANNIIERCTLLFEQGSFRGRNYAPLTLSVFNNSLLEGSATFLARSGSTPWIVRDNLFSTEAVFATGLNENFSPNFNAFRSGLSPIGGPYNQVGVIPRFSEGPLGRFYFGPELGVLVDAGSQSATAVGMYHYTTDATPFSKESDSTVDIGFHYPSLDSNGELIDADADGLMDWTEDPNGNGIADEGETDHLDRDSDLDGESDPDELRNGTDPADARSVPWKSLASWRFDGGTFVGLRGEEPLLLSNVTIVPSVGGRGASFTNPEAPVFLQYRGMEPDGKVNATLAQGAFRFRLRTFWFSNDPELDIPNSPYTFRGVGPGEWVTLVETTNLAVQIDPDGTNIFVLSKTADGQIITNLQARIKVEPEDPRLSVTDPGVSWWYDVVVSYSPDETKVFWGAPGNETTGTGIPRWTGGSLANGVIQFGSAVDGTGKIGATLDDIITYNTPGILHTNPWAFSAAVLTNPVGLNLVWYGQTNLLVDVKRRIFGTKDWEWLPGAIGTNLIDASVVPGERYEYNLNSGYSLTNGFRDDLGNTMTASVLGKAIESRGRVILLVDETLAPEIQEDLGTLITNLVGDGWRVLRADMPRHMDDYSSPAAFATNYFHITNRIAPYIRSNYAAFSNEIKHVLIVGHVTIPYTGDQADDGHWSAAHPYGSHQGTWASDLYYGDTDGIWRDLKDVTWAIFEENWNTPADGKLDDDYVPRNAQGIAELEIPVARIDFARLPLFPESEAELLRRYLRKNARFRRGELTFEATTIGGDLFFDSRTVTTPMQISMEMASKLAVLGEGLQGDVFTNGGSFVLGTQSGSGYVDRINDSRPQEQTTEHFATNRTAPDCAFYLFRSSFFQDWNLENNFMRAVLTPTNGGLAAGWFISLGAWRLDPLASGLELGAATREIMNTRLKPFWGGQSARATQILGDSTLRYPVLPPVTDLTLTRTNGAVLLNWTASEPGSTYNIYRSVNGINGVFIKLNQAPHLETSYSAGALPRGLVVYMVRAVKLSTTGAGSFTNLSQGVFVSP